MIQGASHGQPKRARIFLSVTDATIWYRFCHGHGYIQQIELSKATRCNVRRACRQCSCHAGYWLEIIELYCAKDRIALCLPSTPHSCRLEGVLLRPATAKAASVERVQYHAGKSGHNAGTHAGRQSPIGPDLQRPDGLVREWIAEHNVTMSLVRSVTAVA
jgi:hypothetical protein